MNKVIYGRASPINYVDLPFGERWTITKINGGSWSGEDCCLICSFKDKSVVEISPDGCDNTVIDIIENKYLDFNLEEHLETNRLLEEMNMTESKDTNPKDAVGIKKVPFSTIPANVMGEIALGLMEGARKYGRHNYRVMGVRASVYYDAALRHLMSFWEGEDIDPDSGMSHVSKALSCLVVLRDAMLNEKWNDDRPPKVEEGWVSELNKKAGEIIEKYPEPLEPYTELSLKSFDNKEEVKLSADKSFTIYGPGNRLMGKFPGLKVGDKFEFGTCVYPPDNDGIAVIELTMPFTEKAFLEFEKNWKPKTFGAIKVGSVFNTKVSRYYKDAEATAIVVESSVKNIGARCPFKDTDEIVLISQPE